MNRTLQQTYHVPGTLAADLDITFSAPFAMQLLHISAVASNDSDATLQVGNSGDAGAYLSAATIGDAGTPATFERADFVGGQYPHIAAGSVVKLALDYDGAAGTAAQNVTLVLTFTEG